MVAMNAGASLPFDPASLSFAFTAGVFTFLSPCSFSLLPAYILYYLGRDSSRHDTAWKGLVSAIGILSVFAVLGLISAHLGILLSSVSFSQVSGLIFIAMGIVTLLDLRLPVLTPHVAPPRRADLLGLYLFGIAYGMASIGCSLAMFLSVVAYALSTESFLNGFLSMISYSLGIAIPLLLMAFLGADISAFVSKRSAPLRPWLHRIGGLALMAMGAYLILRSYIGF